MINNSITLIGLDTQKDFFEVAYIEVSRDAKPLTLGRIGGTKPTLQKLVRQFESRFTGECLVPCYQQIC